MKTKLVFAVVVFALISVLSAQSPAPSSAKKPNLLVIFGDDIGQTNISAYSFGVMGYRTPNIDRIAKEGMMFTDYYAEQSRRVSGLRVSASTSSLKKCSKVSTRNRSR